MKIRHWVIPCQITQKKMKFETAPHQILIKLYTLPLYDYNRRPVIFEIFFKSRFREIDL